MVHPSYFSLSGLPSDGAFVIAFSCSAYAFSDLSGSFYDCLFPPASLEKGELFHISFTEWLRFHAPCSLLSPRTNSCLALSMFSQTAIQCLYPVSKGYTIPARSSKLFFFFFDKGAGKNRFNGFISGSQVLTNGALPNSSSSGASLSSEIAAFRSGMLTKSIVKAFPFSVALVYCSPAGIKKLNSNSSCCADSVSLPFSFPFLSIQSWELVSNHTWHFLLMLFVHPS